MVRIRHSTRAIIDGRHDVRPTDANLSDAQAEHYFPGQFQKAEEWADGFILATLTERVKAARSQGFSVEDIQSGEIWNHHAGALSADQGEA